MTINKAEFLTAEIERGPLDDKTGMWALAAWSVRMNMGGTTTIQMAQLLMAIAAQEIVRCSVTQDAAVNLFNDLVMDTGRIVQQTLATKFAIAGHA